MTFDSTVTISSAIAILSAGGAGLGVWFTLRNTVSNHSEQINKQGTQLAAAQVANALVQARIDDVRKECVEDLAAFRVEAAQTYATHQLVREVKEEVNDGMHRITARLDRIIETRGAPRPRQPKP